MKIGELARLANVSTSRIRFYEKHGLIPAPARLENGYREYSEAVVSRLRTITMSKALGFSLSEIKRFLPDDPRDLMQRSDVIANLDSKLLDIDRQIEELKETRENLRKMLSHLKDPKTKVC